MEEIEFKNLDQDGVLDRILNFPEQARGRNVIITMNSHEPDGNTILSNNQFSEYQYVLSVGDHVSDLQPGQKIFLDVERMVEYVPVDDNSHEKLPRVKLKTIEVNDELFGIVSDSLILTKSSQ